LRPLCFEDGSPLPLGHARLTPFPGREFLAMRHYLRRPTGANERNASVARQFHRRRDGFVPAVEDGETAQAKI
jgi:hypothetical protein